MWYWNKICGFAIFFFLLAFSLPAQTVKNPTLFVPVNRLLIIPSPGWLSKNENDYLKFGLSFNIIAQNYYTQHFGFVCKKELKLQKAIKIPLYVRLGSLQQCNYMEGKR